MKTTKKDLFGFFILAFVWMWLINLPRVLASFGLINLHPLVSMIMSYTALFGPAVAAFVMTSRKSGKQGRKELWQNGWRINFNKKWLVPAILLMPAQGLLTLLIIKAADLPIYWEYSLPLTMLVPIGLLIWLVGAYPEEYGWRGYALPRLLEDFNPLAASLILGVIWSLWHLPLHFIEGTTQAIIPIWEYALQTILLSILYTWLHNATGGSVFIAALFHAMGNITGAVIPFWVTTAGRWIAFIILLVVAVVVVIRQPQFFSNKEQTE
jgi:membrane protease YdiL (CAAX protease family)